MEIKKIGEWEIGCGGSKENWFETHTHRNYPINFLLDSNEESTRLHAKEGRFSSYPQQNNVCACHYHLVIVTEYQKNVDLIVEKISALCHIQNISPNNIGIYKGRRYIGFDSLLEVLDFIEFVKNETSIFLKDL